jgi:hypothetical protein
MRMILAIFLFSTAAFAQSTPPSTAPVAMPCSNLPNTIFEVKTDNGEHAAPQSESGKALVYFLQDDTNFIARPDQRPDWE